MEQFNVIEYDFNSKKVKPYDVLPYFRREWNSDGFDKDLVKDKDTLKKWIQRTSSYQFWARCEYECLIASWPFGSYKMNQDLKKFLSSEFNIDDIGQNIKFTNIIMQDMQKIDVHYQIMMNINVITDILFKEFFNNEKEC